MENPFKTLREKHGLTKMDLAESSYIDVRAIARLEDGLYSNPLPSLVDYWVRKGVDRLTLEGDYDDYIDYVRSESHRKFGSSLIVDKCTGPVHPFRLLRTSVALGLTECAKALAVPVDTLQFFEKKWRLQQSVPKPLKAALNQIGYTYDEIAKFEEHYKAWRTKSLSNGVTFQ